ncbi:hypothetical protein, partial [Mycobacterium marinum]
ARACPPASTACHQESSAQVTSLQVNNAGTLVPWRLCQPRIFVSKIDPRQVFGSAFEYSHLRILV